MVTIKNKKSLVGILIGSFIDILITTFIGTFTCAQAATKVPKKKSGSKKKPGPKKKPSAKKKPPLKKKKSKKGKKTSSHLLKPVFIFLGSALFLVFCLWVALLDFQLREKFEGKRWSVPAKVYSRPLELYQGSEIGASDLIAELQHLQYEESQSLGKPGSFIVKRQGKEYEIEIRTRGFNFSDQFEPSQDLVVKVSDHNILSINTALTRLEPRLIGGIYPSHNEDRVLINLQQTPAFLIEALVLIEDRIFFEHFGVSIKGTLRAAFVNIFSGKFKQGGSTLTQQLVKNFYLTNERTLSRKIKEALMALLLESHYSKNEILESYLNEIHLGQIGKHGIHGFALASEHYFGQQIETIELHQVALLVAIVKGASFYEPRRNPERALKRRNMVLSILKENAFITEEEYLYYHDKPLDVTPESAIRYKGYPAYLDLVKRQLKQDYSDTDLRSEGLRIFTGFDPVLQAKSERALVETIETLKQRGTSQIDKLDGAMVVISPQTGEVQALVGGTDVRLSGFNRALDASRPVGSLLKPAIYLTALESGRFNWASIIDDSPVFVNDAGVMSDEILDDDKSWNPKNFDRKSHGLNGNIPMIEGFSKSYNQASVRLGLELGVPEVIKTLKRLGLNKDIKPYPSVLLGALNLTSFEVAQMYQTIAGGGFNTPLRAIREVQNAQGEQLKSYPYVVEQVVSPENAYLIQVGLQEVVNSGTARSLYRYLPRDLKLAGKTGTTNNQRDSWFVGYSGNLLAAVWLGNDDNTETSFTGSSGALKVWSHLAINSKLEAGDDFPPEDIVWEWLDPMKGELSASTCAGAYFLPLRVEDVPLERSACAMSKQKSPIRKLFGL